MSVSLITDLYTKRGAPFIIDIQYTYTYKMFQKSLGASRAEQSRLAARLTSWGREINLFLFCFF